MGGVELQTIYLMIWFFLSGHKRFSFSWFPLLQSIFILYFINILFYILYFLSVLAILLHFMNYSNLAADCSCISSLEIAQVCLILWPQCKPASDQ